MSHRAFRPELHLNLNVRGLRPSATVAINDLANELVRGGKPVCKLGLGQSPFPVPEPVVAALREHAAEKDYLPVQGLPELREAVADHHRRAFGIDRHAGDVLIGPGSKELMFLLQLVYYGDLVIPTPTWVSYAPQAEIIGRRIRTLPTTFETDWHLTPQQLEELCAEDPGRPRLLILTYPSNPTGKSLSAARLDEIAAVARDNGVIVLSDEIYGKLDHRGRHESIVPRYPEGTIFSGGLSKWCGAGGWRLGLFIFPPSLDWLREAMAATGTETYTSTSAPIQFAAVEAFRGSAEIDRYVELCRSILGTLGRDLARRVAAAGARVLEPDGGFYLFPDFSALAERLAARGITTSKEMCRRLLDETGVAVLPGSVFGRPDTELTMRIAYVDFDGAAALAAAEDGPAVDEAFVHEHCARVITAVDRICAWVGGR